jgi:hypothetical protein
MKKCIIKVLWIMSVGSLAVFYSCKKDKPDNSPKQEELMAPVLTLDKTVVVIEKSSTAALTFTWTSAAVGDDMLVNYRIYMNLSNRDVFTNPFVIDAGQASTYSISGTDLNEALIGTLGVAYHSTVTLKVAVYASLDGYESVLSNEATLTATTTLDYPPALILAGDALAGQWNLSEGVTLNATATEGIYTGQAELLIGPVSLNYGIKFYFSEETSEEGRFLGKDETADFGKLAIYTSGDHKIPLAINGKTTGVYNIEVNVKTLTFTLTKTGDINFTLPDEIHFVGEAVNWKWNWNDPDRPVMSRQTDGIYTLENVELHFGDQDNPLGFKVVPLFNNYIVYYAQDEASVKNNIIIKEIIDSEIPQFYPGKLGYHDGYYTIEMNFNTMVMTLTQTVISPMWIYGPSLPGGWGGSGVLVPNKADGIWEAEEVPLDFTSDGFKVYNGYQMWWPWYGQTAETSFGVMVAVDDQAEQEALADPMFMPQAAGYTNGLYTVTLNMNAMTVTLVKTGATPTPPMWIFGDALPGGWSGSGVLIPNKADGLWEATGVEMDFSNGAGFKVYNGYQAWWPWYGQTAETSFGVMVAVDDQTEQDALADPIFKPGEFGYTDGTYTVTLNLNTMTMTLTEQQ